MLMLNANCQYISKYYSFCIPRHIIFLYTKKCIINIICIYYILQNEKDINFIMKLYVFIDSLIFL